MVRIRPDPTSDVSAGNLCSEMKIPRRTPPPPPLLSDLPEILIIDLELLSSDGLFSSIKTPPNPLPPPIHADFLKINEGIFILSPRIVLGDLVLCRF